MFLSAKVRLFSRPHNPIDKLFYIPNVWYAAFSMVNPKSQMSIWQCPE